MDDFMMYKYLKSKGSDMSEKDFMEKFKRAMKVRRHSEYDDIPLDREWINYNMGRSDNWEDSYNYNRGGGMYSDDMYERMNYMRHSLNEYIDEHKAKQIVSEMYHTEAGKKFVGEKFNMQKAKEVHDKYKYMIPSDVTLEEIYIAINAQYHDYCALFKSWNLSNIEHKIIESALIFWFNDVDYKDKSKVQTYFS